LFRITMASVDDLRTLPDLAFNHIRLLRMALHQMFTSHYQHALGLQSMTTSCQCEAEKPLGQRCSNTAYWRYNGIALCPRDIQAVVEAQVRTLKGGLRGGLRMNLHYPCAYMSQEKVFKVLYSGMISKGTFSSFLSSLRARFIWRGERHWYAMVNLCMPTRFQ